MLRCSHRWLAIIGLPVAAALAFSSAAEAKCTRLAFSVNDYGKDGPIKDAKELLDKYVADWTKQRGITNYTVGKKDVSCELFLDFIVFDEHTCKAEATVCWPEGQGAKPTNAKAPAPAGAPKTEETGSIPKKQPPAKKAAVKSAASD